MNYLGLGCLPNRCVHGTYALQLPPWLFQHSRYMPALHCPYPLPVPLPCNRQVVEAAIRLYTSTSPAQAQALTESAYAR